jgi:hypothetical protein
VWMGRVLLPGETLARWATMATSADVVPLLKASVWRRSVQPRPPGENPRSLDQAVATLWRRTLLEDTALEFMAYGSPLVVRRRCGASWCWLFVWRSSAKLASSPSLVELPWRCCAVCEERRLAPGGGRPPVAFLHRRSFVEARVKMARSRVSSGPTL